MIFSVVVLSLLALLVATDPEPAGSSVPLSPEPPLRPPGKPPADKTDGARSDQIAA